MMKEGDQHLFLCLVRVVEGVPTGPAVGAPGQGVAGVGGRLGGGRHGGHARHDLIKYMIQYNIFIFNKLKNYD